jgi:fucose permease
VKQNIDQCNGDRINERSLFYTLCLANCATGITLILPAAMLPLLVEHTHVSLGIAGWIFASFSAGTLLSALMQAVFSRRINPKYWLLSSMVIVAIVGLVVAWTHVFGVLLMAQFLLGMAFGFVYVTSNVLATRVFLETLSETLNKVQAAFGLGALLGPLLLSFALQILHEPIWAFCVVTILACVTIGSLISVHVPAAVESKIPQKLAGPPIHIFKQVMFWFAISQAFLYMGAEVGFGTWIVTVVTKEAAVPLAVAAPNDTLFWLGLTLGNTLSAQVLQRNVLSERSLLYYCILGGFLSGLLITIFPGNIWTSFATSLLMGFFLGPILPSVMAITSRYFVERLDFISSAMSFGSETAALICPPVMGLVIGRFGASWGMLIPALLCLLVAVPFSLTWWRQTREKGDVSKSVPFPLDDLMRKQVSIPRRVISGSLEC